MVDLTHNACARIDDCATLRRRFAPLQRTGSHQNVEICNPCPPTFLLPISPAGHSLTHIAQVRSSWTINNPVNAKLRPGLAQVLEETPPTAEQHGRQGDFKLVHDTHVQVLLDHIRSTRDANNATARGFPSELKGTLPPVIDEGKRRPTRADPGFAPRVGKNVYRCVKRSLLRPSALALVEHSLAHNVGTDALRGVAKHVIDGAGLSPWSELEVLAEVLLVEDPAHQRTPLSAPVL